MPRRKTDLPAEPAAEADRKAMAVATARIAAIEGSRERVDSRTASPPWPDAQALVHGRGPLKGRVRKFSGSAREKPTPHHKADREKRPAKRRKAS